MKIYTSRPRQFEACQFTGTRESAIEISSWLGSAVRGPLVEGAIAGDYLSVQGPDGSQTVRKGDWLVKDADGLLHVIPDGAFQLGFTPLILQ